MRQNAAALILIVVVTALLAFAACASDDSGEPPSTDPVQMAMDGQEYIMIIGRVVDIKQANRTVNRLHELGYVVISTEMNSPRREPSKIMVTMRRTAEEDTDAGLDNRSPQLQPLAGDPGGR